MKFSDPNYEMLSSYFEDILEERNGTQKSLLIGPNRTVVSEGGLYSILYEKNEDRGFIGHRFKIKEIDGNRFKMTYEGLESTFSVASSAFDIGNEMYFRKDSFFHFWLARDEQLEDYRNYANQERTFLFFGKIWPVTNEDNTYSIEFEGMKDFTLRGLPSHNQTVNMTEWLKVYWDQVHHEMYNMTKTFWSLFDAREVDIIYLGYIAGIYGIEINEEVLNELPLREWVENLPYFLKRVGTYNSLFIVWQQFLSKTKNKLNVYERWGEWCVQDVDGLVDDFEDHNFLEFYGIQASGGAGDVWYSQYAPSGYPTHALSGPSGSCGTNRWVCGENLNYLLFETNNLNCSVGDISEDEIQITGYDPNNFNKQIMAKNKTFSGDFSHCTGVEMSSAVVSATNIVFWALSNEFEQLADHTGSYIALSFEYSETGKRFFRITEFTGSSTSSTFGSQSGLYDADKAYHLAIQREGSILRVRVYSKKRRFDEDLIETIGKFTVANTYTWIHSINSRRETTHLTWTGRILELSVDDVENTLTIASSGFQVITPHYKVEIDLSSEPVGDLYEDENFIMSEELIDELVKNWEYARPVSKYVHYQELIAPKAKVSRTGDSVPLYDLSSKGFFNTFFTGSQFISAGTEVGGENTISYYQDFKSKTWTIQHDLNSEFVLVQPWIFEDGADTAVGASLARPDEVTLINKNTLQMTFNEPVRGVAAIAGSASDGITFLTQSNPVSALDGLGDVIYTDTINHNLNSNTPSGYTTPPGPVIMHYDDSNERVIPEDNILVNISSDTLLSTFRSDINGGSITRRSDYIHYQSDPSDTWEVSHKLNSWVIIQCYDIAGNVKEITPDQIELVDQDNLTIRFAENERGYAHCILVLRDQVIYSPYECDVLGVGICADTLGYWKIGTGTDSAWNPFNENDLESPVTSGTYKNVYEDLYNVYIDFEVSPEVEDIGIREVGLFNYLDQLVFYSRCSELFKPEDVNCFFHYRIGKLESSSSSSSSSSTSSS